MKLDSVKKNNQKIKKIEGKVDSVLRKEIKYISGFFTYNIKNFYNPNLIYTKSTLSFLDNNSEYDKFNAIFLSKSFLNKIINLLAGIELLAIGTYFHNFSIKAAEDKKKFKSGVNADKEREEKDYTIKLLFGDVFYSRAVIYLLKYDDFLIFDNILQALKSVHSSKLLLHQKLLKLTSGNINFEKEIVKNPTLLVDINSLLKTSFILGWRLFLDDKIISNPASYYKVIDQIVLLKSFKDLFILFKLFLKAGDNKINALLEEKEFINNKLDDNMSKLKPEWLKNNLKILAEKI